MAFNRAGIVRTVEASGAIDAAGKELGNALEARKYSRRRQIEIYRGASGHCPQRDPFGVPRLRGLGVRGPHVISLTGGSGVNDQHQYSNTRKGLKRLTMGRPNGCEDYPGYIAPQSARRPKHNSQRGISAGTPVG